MEPLYRVARCTQLRVSFTFRVGHPHVVLLLFERFIPVPVQLFELKYFLHLHSRHVVLRSTVAVTRLPQGRSIGRWRSSYFLAFAMTSKSSKNNHIVHTIWAPQKIRLVIGTFWEVYHTEQIELEREWQIWWILCDPKETGHSDQSRNRPTSSRHFALEDCLK